MTPTKIAEEFGLTVNTVMSTKCTYKCTYEDLYNEYTERLEVLKECQDLCYDIFPSKIQHLFGAASRRYKNTSARNFLINLYSPVNMPRRHKIKRCKQVIEFLKEQNGC